MSYHWFAAVLTLGLALSLRGQAPAAAEHPLYTAWKAIKPGTAVVYEAKLRVEAPKNSVPGGVLSATVVDGLKFVNPNTFAAAFEKLRKEKGMGMSERELEAEFKKRRSAQPQENALYNETRVTLKQVTDDEVVLTVTDLTGQDHPENLDFATITREVRWPRVPEKPAGDAPPPWLMAGLGAGAETWRAERGREAVETCPVLDRATRATACEFRLTGTGDTSRVTRTLKVWLAPEVPGGLAKRQVRQTAVEGKSTVKLEYTQTVKAILPPAAPAAP